MLELICDHQYSWGPIAADRSKWHSDGFSSAVTPLAGETGLRFSTRDSSVVIPRRKDDPWGSMRALRVEMVARYEQHSGGMLVDADQSFRIRFDGPNEIIIEMLGQVASFRFDDLPPGNWISFSLAHDGINQLSYSWGYSLPSGISGLGGGSPFYVPGQVPAVGPEGVWIGNRIGVPAAHLKGSIQSLKIWRLDPQTMNKVFLGRPFTPSQLDCWLRLRKKLDDAARRDPECAAWLDRTLGQIREQFLRRLSQTTPEKASELKEMCKAYLELWTAGKVGSPEMKALMVRLRNWLKDEGLFSADDPDLKAVLDHPCLRNFTEAVGGIDCDPQAKALLGAIMGA